MLCEYSHIKSESLAQIRTTITEKQFFLGIVFYWRTLYVCMSVRSHNLETTI